MDTEQLAIYIGGKIKDYRKHFGWTQLELGQKIGMGKNAISNYEKGFRTPKKDTMFKLADAFKVSIDDLFPPRKSTPSTPQDTADKITPKVTYLDKELKEPQHSQWISNGEQLLKEQRAEQEKATTEIQKEPAEYNSDKIVSMDEYRNRVPETVDFAASAGTGVCQEDNLDMEVMFYEDELAEDYDSVGIVMGSSMEPVLKNGDYLFVKITTDIPNGAISIWQVNGENYVKKFRNNGWPYLESLNPEHRDIELSEDDNIRPLGVVVDVYREN